MTYNGREERNRTHITGASFTPGQSIQWCPAGLRLGATAVSNYFPEGLESYLHMFADDAILRRDRRTIQDCDNLERYLGCSIDHLHSKLHSTNFQRRQYTMR